MRRAILLIISLSLLSFGSGWYLDRLQRDTAASYLSDLNAVRALILSGDLDAALSEQRYLHARWQHDVAWLNCLISHHHTRAVEEALVRLATTLESRWPAEALLAADDVFNALRDVESGHLPTLSNIL